MSNLGSVLKNEITRLARKEVRAQVEPLRKANATYRREIAELKRQIAALSRQSRATARKSATPAGNPADEPANLRFSAKGLQSLRKRLGLSAANFAALVGASGQSVYNWETGKAVPRRSQLAALASVRSLGKREAHKRLAELAD